MGYLIVANNGFQQNCRRERKVTPTIAQMLCSHELEGLSTADPIPSEYPSSNTL
jgi:hypothetical protein